MKLGTNLDPVNAPHSKTIVTIDTTEATELDETAEASPKVTVLREPKSLLGVTPLLINCQIKSANNIRSTYAAKYGIAKIMVLITSKNSNAN
jgi:hypothetical protein